MPLETLGTPIEASEMSLELSEMPLEVSEMRLEASEMPLEESSNLKRLNRAIMEDHLMLLIASRALLDA